MFVTTDFSTLSLHDALPIYVIPGKYDVLAGSLAQPFSVVRIATEAGTISGHSLNVPPGASLTISLSVMAGSVTVEGYAKRAGKAASGAMIVLYRNATG